MATIRNKFHELGNWLNKISWVSMDTMDTLEKIDLNKISKEELSQIIQKAAKDLKRNEEFVIGADKSTAEMKLFIYAELGGDTEVLKKNDVWHCFITRGFRNIVLGCTWPVRKVLKFLKGPKGNKLEGGASRGEHKSG